MRLLITGGSGFIGSAVVRQAVARGMSVVNVDKLTYAATAGSTSAVADSDRYVLEVADVVDTQAMSTILARFQPDRVIHLAAETHVDRSIDRPLEFVEIQRPERPGAIAGRGSRVLREPCQMIGREEFRFQHVSTTMRSLGRWAIPEAFHEAHPYDPR